VSTVTLTAAPFAHVAAVVESYRFPLGQPVPDVPDNVVARLTQDEFPGHTFDVTTGNTPAKRRPARKRTTARKRASTTTRNTEAPS
jgi:hypothetical protein